MTELQKKMMERANLTELAFVAHDTNADIEAKMIAMQANLDYMAMMTGIDIEGE